MIMRYKSDLSDLKSSVNVLDVIGEDVELKSAGCGEYKGLCPFHHDTVPTLWVNEHKQVFNCFSCGEHGDVIEYIKLRDMEEESDPKRKFKGAIKILQSYADNTYSADGHPKVTFQSNSDDYGGHIYPDDDSPIFDPWCNVGTETAKKWVKYDHIYRYNDADGIVGYICRMDATDVRGKIIRPYTLWDKDGVEKWRCKWDTNVLSPLYNYDGIVANPTKPVLIVEGEKCVDAVNALFLRSDSVPTVVPTTWRGGAQCALKTDWKPLYDRKRVILWPDNDDAGQDTIKAVCQRLPQTKVMPIPEGMPKKWDVADFIEGNPEMTGHDLVRFITEQLLSSKRLAA